MKSPVCIAMLLVVMEFIKADISNSSEKEQRIVSRQKRKLPLLFYDFGVSQFVCGFGVPVDLELESVTSGIVFKSQFPLPSKPIDLRNRTTHDINGRFLKDTSYYNWNKVRWNIYQALELWANSLNLNGQECVLRALCEVNQIPFSKTGDLLHDVIHILFAPSSSSDDVSSPLAEKYLMASNLGLSGCKDLHKKCPKSLMEMFSQMF